MAFAWFTGAENGILAVQHEMLLHCISSCDRCSLVGEDSQLKMEVPVCPVHIFDFSKELQAKNAGVEKGELKGPVMATYCHMYCKAASALFSGSSSQQQQSRHASSCLSGQPH